MQDGARTLNSLAGTDTPETLRLFLIDRVDQVATQQPDQLLIDACSVQAFFLNSSCEPLITKIESGISIWLGEPVCSGS